MKNVFAKGDYFAMNCKNITADGLTLYGNYSFDGALNVTVLNSKLLSKIGNSKLLNQPFDVYKIIRNSSIFIAG